jgi:hypothetical protein
MTITTQPAGVPIGGTAGAISPGFTRSPSAALRHINPIAFMARLPVSSTEMGGFNS